MSPQLENVSEVIKQVRRRIRVRDAFRGAAITLAVAGVSLLAVALIAGLLKQRHTALMALRLVPIVTTLTAAWLFVLRPLRARLPEASLARLIEEKCALEDRLVTAVEYSEHPRDASKFDRLEAHAARRTLRAMARDVIGRMNAFVGADDDR